MRADVEGSDAGTTHFGGGDRDEPAAGAQIEHPPPRDQSGLVHRVDEQIGSRLAAGYTSANR